MPALEGGDVTVSQQAQNVTIDILARKDSSFTEHEIVDTVNQDGFMESLSVHAGTTVSMLDPPEIARKEVADTPYPPPPYPPSPPPPSPPPAPPPPSPPPPANPPQA
eukprot:1071570-Prymnesium_polylepis.1